MNHPPVETIRNIAICGHGAAGKSTLLEQFLLQTGAVKPVPGDSGADILDYDELEKAHHHSIESHITHFEHGGKYFQIIDTPGYPDFIGQTIAALHGVDGVWPPKGIVPFDAFHLPFMNTLILLTSGCTVTWAQHALIEGDRKGLLQGLGLTVVMGLAFTALQAY